MSNEQRKKGTGNREQRAMQKSNEQLTMSNEKKAMSNKQSKEI